MADKTNRAASILAMLLMIIAALAVIGFLFGVSVIAWCWVFATMGVA